MAVTLNQRTFVHLVATMPREQAEEVLVYIDGVLANETPEASYWSADFLHAVYRTALARLAELSS